MLVVSGCMEGCEGSVHSVVLLRGSIVDCGDKW